MSDYDSDYEEDDFEYESDEIESDELDEESESSQPSDYISPSALSEIRRSLDRPDIAKLNINEIKDCGKFSPEERADEYRRRGKSPSGVIDGEYNDEYRGNDEYNDEYRDWDANA